MNGVEERSHFEQGRADLLAYLANPGNYPDPYPIFAAVREQEPVHWTEAGIWLVLGYPEAKEAFRTPVLSRHAFANVFVSRFDASTDAARAALDTWRFNLINLDEPDHQATRALVAHAFAPKAVRLWETVIAQAVDELVERVDGLDEYDFLHDFAYVVPSLVTADMVGVPRADHGLFEAWTTAWLSSQFTDQRADVKASVAPLEEFVEYVRRVIEDRRRRPTEGKDLVSILLAAEEEGRRLSESQLIGTIMLLILAGHETTANLIGNGMHSLLQHPDEYRRLRGDPELVPSAVEEFLRFECPARSQPRIAQTDLKIGNATIEGGQPVQVHIGAVNRDPRVFDEPDRLDIARPNNAHLGFGFGAHFCIGLHISRLEARSVFAALAKSPTMLQLAGELEWRNSHVRGLTKLPVRRG